MAVSSQAEAHDHGSSQQSSSYSDGGSDTAGAATVEGRLRALHQMHSKPLFNYLVKLTLGDRLLAEDIVQETFVRAWSHLKRHNDTDLETFRPWLYTVARRLVIDVLRARRSRPAEVVFDDLARFSVSEDIVSDLVVAETVRAALMKLEPKQRALLIELYYHGRSPTEVAGRLNIPVGTVKSRAYYAKRALRSYLPL